MVRLRTEEVLAKLISKQKKRIEREHDVLIALIEEMLYNKAIRQGGIYIKK